MAPALERRQKPVGGSESGHSADTIDPAWLAAVGAELLTKPVAPNAFLQRVRRVLDQARR